jgi:hypothetical protein
MPASLNTGVQARDLGYNVVQALRKRITFLDAGTTVTVGKLPPGASVIGGGVHVLTAFNDTGTDLLDIGFIGATTDADGYASQLNLAAPGFIALDELATATNIQGAVEHAVTCLYSAQTPNPTAGVADVIVQYVSAYPLA